MPNITQQPKNTIYILHGWKRWTVMFMIWLISVFILWALINLLYFAWLNLFTSNHQGIAYAERKGFIGLNGAHGTEKYWFWLIPAIIALLPMGTIYYAVFIRHKDRETWDSEHKTFHSPQIIKQPKIKKVKYNFKNADMLYLNSKIGIIKKHLNRHTLLMGGTGWGKTSLLLNLWNQKRIDDEPIIFVDGKGDTELIAHMKLLDPDLFVWSVNTDEGEAINLLEHDDVNVIHQKIFTSMLFENEFYKSVADYHLFQMINLIKTTNHLITFKNMYQLCTKNGFERLISESKLTLTQKQDFQDYAKDIKNENLAGLRNKIGAFERYIKGGFNGKTRLIDLLKAKRNILFSINSAQGEIIANFIGNMLINELKAIMFSNEYRDLNLENLMVILDEFNAFASKNIENLINKARGAKIDVVLSFQTLKDLVYQGGNLKEVVFGNTHNFVFFHTNEPSTAEFIARLIGTSTSIKETQAIAKKNGEIQDRQWSKGSLREVQEYIVHPSRIKKLAKGEVVLQLLDNDEKSYKGVQKIDYFDIDKYLIKLKDVKILNSKSRYQNFYLNYNWDFSKERIIVI